jgi:mannose-6-phosphate isomerase-like protein (cupin superfamily)
MFSFLASHPARSRNAHLSEIAFDSGASILTFNEKESQNHYPITNSLPPAPPGSLSRSIPHHQPNSVLLPPLHWHLWQDEKFHVLTGTARFLLDGKEEIVPAGSEIIVPKGALHCFSNGSETERLVLEFGLSPARKEDEM